METKYSGKSCYKCGCLIELVLETPSSNPCFRDEPLEWVDKHHNCIYHLKEEIADLRGKLDYLRNEVKEIRFIVDSDNGRF